MRGFVATIRSTALALPLLVSAPARSQPIPDAVLSRYAENPMLSKGPAGSYDALKLGPRAILREAPNVWKMWYEAAPTGNTSSTAYATSSDGLNWTKYAGNPVMSPSVAWEGGPGPTNCETSPTAVLKEDGLYKLWYHGYANNTRQIGYAESLDGLTWTKYAGNPVLTPGAAAAWDADSVCEPRVLRVGAEYYMFYTRCTGTHGIGLATSPDGKSWTKYAGNPVFVAAAGDVWDNLQISWGEVYYDGERFYMWYPGRKTTDTAGFSLGVATSPDGKTWTRSPSNPVMTPPASALGKGDDLGVESSPTVVRMGDTLRVYYGGFRSCCPEDTTLCLATTASTGVANRAPTVDAGRDQTFGLAGLAALNGTVMDDDAPVTLGNVETTWSKQSGPGTVTFDDANAVDTTAAFSLPGTYVLTLAASDTELTGSDTVTVTVSAIDPGAGGAGGSPDQGGADSGGTADSAGEGGSASSGNQGATGGRTAAGGSTSPAGAGGAAGRGGTAASSGGVPGASGRSGSGAGGANQGNGGSVAGAKSAQASSSSSDCGCRTVPASSTTTGVWLLALGVLHAGRRRRRSSRFFSQSSAASSSGGRTKAG
jgi:MYXO-CTERM domain-containing protein